MGAWTSSSLPDPACPTASSCPPGSLSSVFSWLSRPRWPVGQHHGQPGGAELELAAYDGFTPTQRRRVTAALGDRIVVAAGEHRSQHRNRVAARERMAEAIRAALAPPPPARRATKPRGSPGTGA